MSAGRGFVAEVGAFCAAARARRQLRGPAACARRTAEILRLLVANGRHPDPCSLIADVRKWGAEMQAAAPLELSIGNMVRRVLHMIREESAEECNDNDSSERDAFAEGRLPSALALAASQAGFGGSSGGGGFDIVGGDAAADALAARAGGLLSRALRPGGRTVSLHNLLDESKAAAAAGAAGGVISPTSPTSPAARAAAVAAASIGGGSSGGGSSRPTPSPKQQHQRGLQQQQQRKPKGSKLPPWPGRSGVIEQLNELIDELDEMDTAIAMRAGDHIHANEIVLTLGHDPTTLLFLLEAAKRRTFQVVVAEAAPSYSGREAAVALARAGVASTLISDAAIFAVMARVHKVVLSARALLADGGVLAPAGARLVAAAAARHAAPFVALCGLHCLSPLFPHDPALATNDFGDPGDVLDYAALPFKEAAPRAASVEAARALALAVAEGGAATSDRAEGSKGKGGDGASSDGKAATTAASAAAAAAAAAAATGGLPHVLNPTLDVVPPDLVSLLVTDTGCYTPSYVYRLLAEYYSREDYSI